VTPGALAIAQAQVVESVARLMLVLSRMDGDQLDRLNNAVCKLACKWDHAVPEEDDELPFSDDRT